jgi:hypothetical protein
MPITEITLPTQTKGERYQKCYTINGNALSYSVDYTDFYTRYGSQYGAITLGRGLLCIDVVNPSVALDFEVAVRSGQKDSCRQDLFRFKAAIESSPDEKCACVPVTVKAGTVPALPVDGGRYFHNFLLEGTGPFELCGGSAPQCLEIRLDGNVVTVSGKYNGIGSVKFSVKNACTCDCVDVEIN